MLAQQIASDCRTEVRDLHAFFTGWFCGTLEATDAVWASIEAVIAPGFHLITPGGALLSREALLAGLRPLHGQHGPGPNFAIEIRDFHCRRFDDETVLVTYEEWQVLRGVETGRLSTALLERTPAARNRVRWLHVHETALGSDAAR